MSRVRIACTSLVTAFALGACSGGGQPASPIVAPLAGGAPVASQPQYVATGFSYDVKTLQKAKLQSTAKFGGFGFDVTLRMSNVTGLLQYASQVGDPKSGQYRRFLTPAEIGQRFGAPATTVAAAQKYFSSYGLKITTWPQNMMMHVAGTQSALQSAFNTTFGVYRLGTDTFIGPTKSPSVPTSIGVAGSPNIVAWQSRYLMPHVKSGSALSDAVTGYAPQLVAAGFDYTGAYAAGYTGKGINVGIIGTGPVAVSGNAGIRVGDLDATRSLFGVGGSSKIVLPPVGNAAGTAAFSASGFTTPLPVNSGSGCAAGGLNPNDGIPGSESPTTTCNPEDIEAQIDTESAGLLAPNSTVEYYLAYNPNDFCNGLVAGSPCAAGSGIPAQGLFESDAEIQQAIADNTADVLSLSFGESEYDVEQTADVSSGLTYKQFEQSEFAALASEGIATFVSTGDYGAENCQSTGPIGNANDLCASYPATDPNVTGVGGVTIPLNGAGQLQGPIAAWGVQTSAGTSGSGGGISILFPTPTYQAGVDYFSPSGETALPMRGNPDISLLGDPRTGIAVVTNADPSLGGFSKATSVFGGTSVAAPEMAAMWSLVLQACSQSTACTAKGGGPHPYRLGAPNPLLYAIYGNGTGANYASTIDNVTYGTNAMICEQPVAGASPEPGPPCATSAPSLLSGFSAGPGYDLVTGIGAPFARQLIKTVVGV